MVWSMYTLILCSHKVKGTSRVRLWSGSRKTANKNLVAFTGQDSECEESANNGWITKKSEKVVTQNIFAMMDM